ncbi:MAG: anti-sigma factor [Azospirillaceae bacterium]
MIPASPEDRRLHAALYVLGLLDETETAEARRHAESDAGFAAEIAGWQARLAPLARTVDHEAPPDDLWPAIAAATRPADAGADPAAPPAAVTAPRGGRSRRAFAILSLAASLLVGVLAGLGIAVLTDAPEPEALVAVLVPPDQPGQPGYIVRVDAERNVVLQRLGDAPATDGGAIEFWTLADPALGPSSLGLVEASAQRYEAVLEGDAAPGRLFELTLEPAGGSPTGRPTGPVLYIGRAVSVD